ncbi:MAG TPA: mersacidin/lichenicidin family type 2 lantibiotic [Ktedonobacteraceae bacterium]|nr:mersacidin/lichenicidin family type 2 lantibiotic [Ktedonobacteraceae bacterium]
MSELDVIRAWKDRAYRNSLSADELAQLPEHPAGAIELTDDELTRVDGAAAISIIRTLILPCTFTYCTLLYCTFTYCPVL